MLALERPTVLRQFARPRRDRGRVPHAPAVRDPLRHVGRRARRPLADRAVGAAERRAADLLRFWPTALPVVLAVARIRREARLGRIGLRLARRLLGALARLRPAPGRQVVRVPPRRLRRLPRDRAGRGRADRPRGPWREPGRSGIEARGGVRCALRLRQRLRPARRRRVHEHARGATTDSTTATGSTSFRCGSSGSSSGSPRACRDRSLPSAIGAVVAARARADPALRPARQRGGHRHGPWRALGARSRRSSRAGPASGRLALGLFVVGLVAATFLLPRADRPCRAPASPSPRRSPPRRTSRGSG